MLAKSRFLNLNTIPAKRSASQDSVHLQRNVHSRLAAQTTINPIPELSIEFETLVLQVVAPADSITRRILKDQVPN